MLELEAVGNTQAVAAECGAELLPPEHALSEFRGDVHPDEAVFTAMLKAFQESEEAQAIQASLRTMGSSIMVYVSESPWCLAFTADGWALNHHCHDTIPVGIESLAERFFAITHHHANRDTAEAFIRFIRAHTDNRRRQFQRSKAAEFLGAASA